MALVLYGSAVPHFHLPRWCRALFPGAAGRACVCHHLRPGRQLLRGCHGPAYAHAHPCGLRGRRHRVLLAAGHLRGPGRACGPRGRCSVNGSRLCGCGFSRERLLSRHGRCRTCDQQEGQESCCCRVLGQRSGIWPHRCFVPIGQEQQAARDLRARHALPRHLQRIWHAPLFRPPLHLRHVERILLSIRRPRVNKPRWEPAHH